MVKPVYQKVLAIAKEPHRISDISRNLSLSYKRTWNVVKQLETAELLSKTEKGYVSTGNLRITDLVRYPFLLRSRHVYNLLLLMNLKPVGVREAARLLETSPSHVRRILEWLKQDKLVVKTREGKYEVREHFADVEGIGDWKERSNASRFLRDIDSSVKAVVFAQGEFLVTMDTELFLVSSETVKVANKMRATFMKGVIMPHFGWLIYLAGGHTKNPSLAQFLLGVPVYGTPWLDPYALAEELLKTPGFSEREVKKAISKGLLKRTEKGLKSTPKGTRKLVSVIKGEIEYVKIEEDIRAANLH